MSNEDILVRLDKIIELLGGVTIKKPKQVDPDHPNHGKPWTEEDRTFAVDSFKRNIKTAEIARTLGRRQTAVLGILVKAGLLGYDTATKKHFKLFT